MPLDNELLLCTLGISWLQVRMVGFELGQFVQTASALASVRATSSRNGKPKDGMLEVSVSVSVSVSVQVYPKSVRGLRAVGGRTMESLWNV